VKPDQPLTVPKLMSVMRDRYEGTEFDLTRQPAFQVGNSQSPLACPWGPPELLDLLGLKPERAICTPSSGYVFVAQLRSHLPASIGNLLWFAYGPADTSCFIPLYAGVTDLPDAWDHPASFTRIDRQQPQWNFRLVHNLTHCLPYQKVVQEIEAMVKPPSKGSYRRNPSSKTRWLTPSDKRAVGRRRTVDRVRNRLRDPCGFAYHQLVDYLMLRF
jgi:dipeptidase